MRQNTELFQEPAQQWKSSPKDKILIEQLLASEDELDKAYGEAYQARCFVTEFGDKITAVGELDTLAEVEFRLGIELDPGNLSLGDCVELAYPGLGETRAERVRDGLSKVLEERARRGGVE